MSTVVMDEETPKYRLLPLLVLARSLYKLPEVYASYERLVSELTKFETLKLLKGEYGRYEFHCDHATWMLLYKCLILYEAPVGSSNKKLKAMFAALSVAKSLLDSSPGVSYVATSGGAAVMFVRGSPNACMQACHIARVPRDKLNVAMLSALLAPNPILLIMAVECPVGCSHGLQCAIVQRVKEQFGADSESILHSLKDSPKLFPQLDYVVNMEFCSYWDTYKYLSALGDGYCYRRAVLSGVVDVGPWPTVGRLRGLDVVTLNHYARCVQRSVGVWHVLSSDDDKSVSGTLFGELPDDAIIGGIKYDDAYGMYRFSADLSSPTPTYDPATILSAYKAAVARISQKGRLKSDVHETKSFDACTEPVSLYVDTMFRFVESHMLRGSLLFAFEAITGPRINTKVNLKFDAVDNVVGVFSMGSNFGDVNDVWYVKYAEDNVAQFSFVSVVKNPIFWIVARPESIKDFAGSRMEDLAQLVESTFVFSKL